VSSAKKKMRGIDTKRKLYEVQSDEKLEVHHVNPKNFNGSNKLKNLVLLTHEEHKYAHFLLNLALVQRHNYGELMSLSYTDVPSGLLKMVEARRSALRGLKIDIFVSGKKHPPTTMSIIEAARLLCILARVNPDNRLLLDSMVTEAVKLSMFHKSKFGYKMKFHM
jgi:hypothetical protein